eukprot:403375765
MDFSISIPLKKQVQSQIQVNEIVSLKSTKEEQVRLTPPIFCKIQPFFQNFTTINGSDLLQLQKQNSHTSIVLDDLIINLVEREPLFQILQLSLNDTDPQNLTVQFTELKNYTFNGNNLFNKRSTFQKIYNLHESIYTFTDTNYQSEINQNYFIVEDAYGDKYIMQLEKQQSLQMFSSIETVNLIFISKIEDYINDNRLKAREFFNGIQINNDQIRSILLKTQSITNSSLDLDSSSVKILSDKYTYHSNGRKFYYIDVTGYLALVDDKIAENNITQAVNITQIGQVYDFKQVQEKKLLVIIQNKASEDISIEEFNINSKNGDLILHRSHGVLGCLQKTLISSINVDNNYIYVNSKDNQLCIIEYNTSLVFKPQYFIFNLNSTDNLFPIPAFIRNQNQNMFFAQSHANSNLLTVHYPFNHSSDSLTCTAFPKPNQYNINIRSYSDTCNLKQISESVGESDLNEKLSYCVMEQFIVINATYPEEETLFTSKTTKNLAVIISISVILGTLFFGSVAYTIYWKTKNGWYDDQNNEISDPDRRRENVERMHNYNQQDDDDEVDQDDIIIRSSQSHRSNQRSDGFERVDHDSSAIHY